MKIDTRRRRLLGGALGAAAATAIAPHAAAATRRRALDLADPADCLYAVVKLRGDLSGAQVLQWYTGTLSLLVPGRQAAPVARYQGVIRTTWTPRDDGSFHYRTFDLGFFGDLATGKPVESLQNPITGATLVPQDVRDGPIESRYTLNGVFRDGAPVDTSKTLSLPWVRAGDEVWYSADLAFERPNPLPPAEYPDYSNSMTSFQRTQFTYKGRLSDLEDATTTRAPMTTIQLVASTPMPWLQMGRVPAVQQIQTVSHKIASIAEASPEIRGYIERVVPNYLSDATPFAHMGSSADRFKRERLGGP